MTKVVLVSTMIEATFSERGIFAKGGETSAAGTVEVSSLP